MFGLFKKIFKKEKPLLEQQAIEFIEYWEERFTKTSAETYEYWLQHFIPFLSTQYIEDATDARDEDIEEFRLYVTRFKPTFFFEEQAERVARNFISHAKRVKMQQMKATAEVVARKKPGPKTNPHKDAMIKEMVEKKGLSFREIGEIMGRHHSTVYEMYQRIVGEK